MVCEACGKPLQAQRSTRKTCSDRCRARLNARKRRQATLEETDGGQGARSDLTSANFAEVDPVLSVSDLSPESDADPPTAGKRLWAAVVEKYVLTAAEMANLGEACRTADELDRLERAV